MNSNRGVLHKEMGRKRRVNAGAIIAAVMERNGVSAEDIPVEKEFCEEMIKDDNFKSKRYFLAKGQAGFVCTEVDGKTICRQWSSYQGNAVIDLKEQRVIVEVGKQGCRKCDDEMDKKKWKTPHFGERAIESMAEHAVQKYLGNTGRGRGHVFGRPAHDEGRCYMCKLKGRRCC